MNDAAHQTLKELEEWTESPIPEFFKELSEDDLSSLKKYVHEVVAYETDGLDELYTTISHVIKHVPNFVLLPMITRFIKPPIAAGVCAKLTVKQSVSIASGLSAEYLGEVTTHLENRLAADILAGLKPKLAEQCIEYEVTHHPMKAMEISQFASDDMLKIAAKHLHLFESIDPALLKDYQEQIDKIRSLS